MPGRRLSDGFPVAPRDCIVDASCTFEPVDPETLAAAFHTAHTACQRCRNADGGWGGSPDSEKPAYRWPANVTLGYLYGYEALGEEQYRKLALGGLDYLLDEQDENGAFRWWYKAVPGGVMNQRDNFYDTGWAGLALAEGFRATGEEKYLDAVRRAADWTMTCPFTGNNNYDAFASGFSPCCMLSPAKTNTWRRPSGVPGAASSLRSFPGADGRVTISISAINPLPPMASPPCTTSSPGDHSFSRPLRDRLCAALNFTTFLQAPTGGPLHGLGI